jgi:hypothetical protein
VRARFAQYLTARAGLLQTIEDLKPMALGTHRTIDERTRLRAFVVAYTATALLVRAGQFIIDHLAPNKTAQRKLNEAEPRFGIPRKQFTAIYRSLTSPLNAWRIHEAVKFADAHRAEIEALADETAMVGVLAHLNQTEEALVISARRYFKSRLRYRWHALRRRRDSAFGQAMFGLFEISGRIIAELRNPFHAKRVTPEIQRKLGELLRPGDVLISRHDDALSNLFLPGYWIHASLHIGPEWARHELGIQVDAERAGRWVDPIRVLEAKKDGVLFRPLSETLAVDAVAVIRPMLAPHEIALALSQAISHEGKLYDFEFDFFRSDRLVCTEVVYRGYHGVGGLEFQLTSRAGRPTLAAEELLSMALDGRGFASVAVFGAGLHASDLLVGPPARQTLASSLNRSEHSSYGRVPD